MFKEYILVNKELEELLKTFNKKNNIQLPKTSDNQIELKHFIQYLHDLNLIHFPRENYYYKSSN